MQVIGGVFGLGLGEAAAGTGRKLLDQPLLTEALPFAEIAVGGIDGLLVPIRVEVADGELGVRLQKTFTRARRELVQ
jgi:hypothetical protein